MSGTGGQCPSLVKKKGMVKIYTIELVQMRLTLQDAHNVRLQNPTLKHFFRSSHSIQNG